MSNAPEIPRTVRPRKLSASWLPLIVIHEQTGNIFLERTGEILPISSLATVVLGEPSSYIISMNAAGTLAELDSEFKSNPNWQFRGSPVKREVMHHGSQVPTGQIKTSSFVVAFFGFRNENPKKKGRYHYPIDPMVFLRRSYESLGGGGIKELIRWGVDMREWCVSQGLIPKPTAGGIAGQLLKDPRFYPVSRRKVPRATNATARPALPGNHYRLYASESRTYRAQYLDLGSAHHNAALTVTFPHADNLYARGNFHLRGLVDNGHGVWTPASGQTVRSSWVKPGSKTFENLVTRAHGMLLVELEAPVQAAGTFPLPCLEKPGRKFAWVYTNELEDLLAARAVIVGIEAAWVSFRPDVGLNRYAAWALDQTAQATAERRAWLKPVLLSTYGILASKPRTMEFAYAKAKGGKTKIYPAGGRLLEAQTKETLTASEMNTANVIHRGMIEAETRLQVLKLARYLHASGCNVLSVYADSVIVEDDAVPLIPHPWKNKGTLTNLRFFHASAFVSDELCKLPGIPLNSLLRTELIEDARRVRPRLRQECNPKNSLTKEIPTDAPKSVS